jgi:hypothetical protein
MADMPEKTRWQPLNWFWVIIAATILGCGFARYHADSWRSFVFWGVLCASLLAILPPTQRRGESWFCVAVIASCGLFGGWQFVADFKGIAPSDRQEFLRLYICAGIVGGIALVLPYVLIRLLLLRILGVARGHNAAGV